jgi:hypothetical protein
MSQYVARWYHTGGGARPIVWRGWGQGSRPLGLQVGLACTPRLAYTTDQRSIGMPMDPASWPWQRPAGGQTYGTIMGWGTWGSAYYSLERLFRYRTE